jgi:hypothetical protein
VKDNLIGPADLLGDEPVLRAGVDRAPVDRITELRLRLLAYDAASATCERVLQPSLLDFLA